MADVSSASPSCKLCDCYIHCPTVPCVLKLFARCNRAVNGISVREIISKCLGNQLSRSIVIESVQAPVVQRPDNFIQWISHYPTVSICAKISVFPRAQANMHTLTRA